MKFEFGWWYHDTVTGFKGICAGVCHYMTGCDQVLLVPRCQDKSKRPDAEWFDSDRLQLLPNKKKVELPSHDRGGDILPPTA